MTMQDLNDFAPRPLDDRRYSSYRTAGDRRHTRVATAIESMPGDVEGIFGELLLEMRAIRIGIERLCRVLEDDNDIDLVDIALSEADEDAS